jgi:hypothetical protein
MHRADWNTIVPGGVGKSHYPLSKAKKHYFEPHKKNKIKKRRYYFHTDTRIKIVL